MRNQYKALSEKYVSEAVILPQEGYDYFDEILEAIIEVSLITGNEPLNEVVTRAINARLFEYNIKFNVLEFPGGGSLAIAPPGNVIWIAPKISQHIYNLIKKSQKISSDPKQIRLILLKDPVVQLTKHTFAHELIHKVQTNKAKMFVPYSNKVVKKHGMRPITSYTSDEINKIPNFMHWYYDTLHKKVYPNEPKEIMTHAYELAQALIQLIPHFTKEQLISFVKEGRYKTSPKILKSPLTANVIDFLRQEITPKSKNRFIKYTIEYINQLKG